MVSEVPELGPRKLAETTPETLDRSNKMSVAATVLIAICMQVDEIANVDNMGNTDLPPRCLGPFTIWVVLQTITVLRAYQFMVG